MALMGRASHVIQWCIQRVANPRGLVEFVHFALFEAACVLKQLIGELFVLSLDAFILALADHNVHRLGVECG